MNICIRVSGQTKSRLSELSKEMGISRGKLVEKLLSNFNKFRSEDK
jgi:predicted DNA-binding protein